MVKHTVCRELNGFIRMKILCLHNSYHTPGVEDQIFAPETDLKRCHGHQGVQRQGLSIVQTLPVGAQG
jgi:hypothetical protein